MLAEDAPGERRLPILNGSPAFARSSHHTTVSLVRTIGDVLGLRPLGLNDGLTEPMAELFDLTQEERHGRDLRHDRHLLAGVWRPAVEEGGTR